MSPNADFDAPARLAVTTKFQVVPQTKLGDAEALFDGVELRRVREPILARLTLER
jgi:hypothetical protein